MSGLYSSNPYGGTPSYAPSAYAPSAYAPSAYAPSAYAPSAYAPSAYAPSAYAMPSYSPPINDRASFQAALADADADDGINTQTEQDLISFMLAYDKQTPDPNDKNQGVFAILDFSATDITKFSDEYALSLDETDTVNELVDKAQETVQTIQSNQQDSQERQLEAKRDYDKWQQEQQVAAAKHTADMQKLYQEQQMQMFELQQSAMKAQNDLQLATFKAAKDASDAQLKSLQQQNEAVNSMYATTSKIVGDAAKAVSDSASMISNLRKDALKNANAAMTPPSGGK